MTYPHTTRTCAACRQQKPAHRVYAKTGICSVCAGSKFAAPSTSRTLPPAPQKLVGRWPMDALTSQPAMDRLARAGAELAEVRNELRADSQRAFQAAARREQERAQRLEQQEINRQLVVAGVDELELAHMAPGIARERRRAVVEP